MAAEMLGQYHRSPGASQAKNVTYYEMIFASSQGIDLVAKNRIVSGISYAFSPLNGKGVIEGNPRIM